MLSQTRRLNVIGNNMANLSTPGYKSENYTDLSFGEVFISRVGNKDKSGAEVIGEESYILAADQLYVNYAPGGLDDTGMNLDFAIRGDGFFAIQTDNGTEYTRGGSFALDENGYLYLPNHGRVLGADGRPIRLMTDNITADTEGRIYSEEGDFLGQIGAFIFLDNNLMQKNESGLFGANGQTPVLSQTQILWKWVENSNVDMVREMTQMMTAQRALQSAAQVMKLYEGLLTKATGEIARM